MKGFAATARVRVVVLRTMMSTTLAAVQRRPMTATTWLLAMNRDSETHRLTERASAF